MTRNGLRARLGEALLAAFLVANFAFGAALIVALRADMARDILEDESSRVSAKVGEYLWGKIVLFTTAVGEDGRSRVREGIPPGIVSAPSVRDRLPSEPRFRRIRSGTGEWLPVFVGFPEEGPARGAVLPLAFQAAQGPEGERFVAGAVSLGDLAGYLAEQRRHGIHCRLVDASGNHLFGERGAFPPIGGGVVEAVPVLDGILPDGWSLQLAIPGVSARLPFLPQVLLACVIAGNSLALLFLHRWFLAPHRRAVGSILDTLAEHGETLPSRMGPASVADGVRKTLDRRRADMELEKRRLSECIEERVGEMKKVHQNLVLHHKITKRMLQARELEEVFDALLAGISEGYGFQGASAGKVSRDGHMVFAGDPLTRGPVRIPLWDPRSLIARMFWAGGNALLTSPRELPHLPEEEVVLGSASAYIMPVMRTQKTRCAEIRNCGDRSCPAFSSENLRCWMRQVPLAAFTPDSDPDSFREEVLECLACEVFPSAGMVVVREVSGSPSLTRESVLPIAGLSSEAALAMEVVTLYDNMKIMAVTDGLTGLYNHREFYNALRRELERARRYRHTLSLLIIDVDDFKQFNDRYGHPAGDNALRKIAELLRRCARTTDILSRYGGEEFAVILPESTPSGALMVAERIKVEIGGHNFIFSSKVPVNLTVSIGIYSTEDGGMSEDQIVSLADEAAYLAKKSGKNRVVVKAAV